MDDADKAFDDICEFAGSVLDRLKPEEAVNVTSWIGIKSAVELICALHAGAAISVKTDDAMKFVDREWKSFLSGVVRKMKEAGLIEEGDSDGI